MKEEKHTIKQWAKDDRPREKLLRKNPESLSDSELLAILIRTGTPSRSAVGLAKEVLKLGKDNLYELGRVPVREFMKIKGIGQAKAVTIAAALELGRRRQSVLTLDRPLIKDSKGLAAYLQSMLRDYRHEVFAVIYMNQAGRVRHFGIVSQGGMTATVADPRLILRKALEEEAVSLILCHNHPSGNLYPSKADEDLTRRIREAAGLLDIKVLDHIIVSEQGYYSFADAGMM